MAAMKRVGHMGADLLAPGNTLASFDAALAAGVDMIEFDVLPANAQDPGGSALVLSHDYEHLAQTTPVTLEAGLDHLAGPAFAGLDFDVDLKTRGYEVRVVGALRERGLIERVLVSSTHRDSLAAVRAAEPRLRLGWSVPNFKRDYSKSPLLALPALAWLQVLRARLPRQVREGMQESRFDALMAHWRMVDARLLRTVHAVGGELYVWTVDDAQRIRRLRALGVDAVVTNDPRLFSAT